MKTAEATNANRSPARGIRAWLLSMAAFAALALSWGPFSGCADSRPTGPEPVAYGRDTCARCRMHLTQPGLVAELRAPDGSIRKYDDIGCMIHDARAAAGERAPASIPEGWIEDHAGAGWVPLREATFVRTSSVTTPMGYGILGFKDAAAAARFAKERGGEVVAPSELFAKEPRVSEPRGAGAAAGGDRGAERPSAPAKPGGPRPLSEGDAKEGKAIYLRECSACHGERGDGRGPAAPYLDPKPRDFSKAKFKLRSTPSGKPPTTDDVLRVIERGIPGSSMPSFAFLTADERRKVAAYVLEKADLLDGKEPAPIADPGEPLPATPELLARGKAVYAELQCAGCHGPEGKGDGPTAKTQKDDEGRPIVPRDFTAGVFRGGSDPKDLVYRFVTGMDGSAMPGFGDAVKGADRWALAHYVLSLHAPAPPKPLPKDPLAAGRAVAAKYGCRGCHVLDDGKGGDVGPDLRISGQKLDGAWTRTFLRDPRAPGKIYPWRVHRMPKLALDEAEIDALARYLAKMGKRASEAAVVPDPSLFPEAKVTEGKNVYGLRCPDCHNLGTVIEIPLPKRQGPDLIDVAGRVDYEWAHAWILDPKKIDPKSRMTVPGITPEQADAVRMFIWKLSLEERARKSPTR